MNVSEIRRFARKYLQAYGTRAEVEAAQNAAALEQQGEMEQAATWRRVQTAIKEMRGPHVS